MQSLAPETVITSAKRPFPGDEVGCTDVEEVESGHEEQNAAAVAEGSNPAQAMGKKRGKKARKERVKIKKREDSEWLAADFRSTMSTDETYEGVISYVDPRFPRGSVRIEGTPLMGFFSIPADTLCGVGQTVLLPVMPETASFFGSTALRVELVFHTADRYFLFQSTYFEEGEQHTHAYNPDPPEYPQIGAHNGVASSHTLTYLGG